MQNPCLQKKKEIENNFQIEYEKYENQSEDYSQIDYIFEQKILEQYQNSFDKTELNIYLNKPTNIHFIEQMNLITTLKICSRSITNERTFSINGIENSNISKLTIDNCQVNAFQLNNMDKLEDITIINVSTFDLHNLNFAKIKTVSINGLHIYWNNSQLKIQFEPSSQQTLKFIEYLDVSKLTVCGSYFMFIEFPKNINFLIFQDYLGNFTGLQNNKLQNIIIQNGISNSVDFQQINNIEYLEINNKEHQNSFDISCLCDFQYLKTLKINNFQILLSYSSLQQKYKCNEPEDLQYLGILSSLTHLNISNNIIDRINDRVDESLDDYENYNKHDYSLLFSCSNLIDVNFNNNQNLDLILFNKHYSSIKKLNISQCYLCDISLLDNCSYLTDFDISDNQIFDISVIKNFTYLEHLHAHSNYIVDISSLLQCKKIKHINLSNNRVFKLVEFSTCLISANFHNNFIFDFGNIQTLPYYNIIWIGHQNVVSVEYFKHSALWHVSYDKLIDLLEQKKEILLAEGTSIYHELMLKINPQHYNPLKYREDMIQCYASQVQDNELLLDNKLYVDSLKFIEHFEQVSKLVIKYPTYKDKVQVESQMQNINFNTIPKQIQELQLLGIFTSLEGIEHSNISKLRIESCGLSNFEQYIENVKFLEICTVVGPRNAFLNQEEE
ncbi:leucine-rich_repeat domain-containing protein [Hexamita inflata]|uniref:Leucine-rich repeat domain-containing protein n=1 Tax=Hexamita inflata TaxID=28002 RepID=A0AA86R2Y7_9EUKA|nr:leucine-rich repeat domain-containing protein [Hexamita inflata]